MLTRNVVLAAALLSGQMVPSGAIRACDGGFSEPALPAEARDPFDRTWIKTGASIYLAIPGRGVFQARLDSNALNLSEYTEDSSTTYMYLLAAATLSILFCNLQERLGDGFMTSETGVSMS